MKNAGNPKVRKMSSWFVAIDSSNQMLVFFDSANEKNFHVTKAGKFKDLFSYKLSTREVANCFRAKSTELLLYIVSIPNLT